MLARDIVLGVLVKYSNPKTDETCCRMSELVDEFTKVIEKFERERDNAVEVHEAWMQLQARSRESEGKSFFRRMLP